MNEIKDSGIAQCLIDIDGHGMKPGWIFDISFKNGFFEYEVWTNNHLAWYPAECFNIMVFG